jgi:hypothetical protein
MYFNIRPVIDTLSLTSREQHSGRHSHEFPAVFYDGASNNRNQEHIAQSSKVNCHVRLYGRENQKGADVATSSPGHCYLKDGQ